MSSNSSNAPSTPGSETPQPSSTSINNNSGGGRNTRNKNLSTGQGNQNIGNQNTLEGAQPDIGAVLGLRHEKLKHKKASSYENFLEKLGTFILSNFKDGGDLKPLFRRMEDPTTSFRSKRTPIPPIDTAEVVYKDIYKEEIKMSVSRESNLRRNMEKTFGLL